MSELAATNNSIASPESSGEVTLGSGLQALRVSILARERGRPLRILYASAAESSPSPRAALGLAYATASSSLATVLVDATGGAGEVTTLLGLEANPGFTDMLVGNVEVQGALTTVSGHLLVLPGGRPEPRVEDLLTGPLIKALFDEIAQIADVLIIATGPMLSPRSQALAMVTDVFLVEAEEGQSRLADLVAITEDSTLAGSVLGVVFVEGRGPGRALPPRHDRSRSSRGRRDSAAPHPRRPGRRDRADRCWVFCDCRLRARPGRHEPLLRRDRRPVLHRDVDVPSCFIPSPCWAPRPA